MNVRPILVAAERVRHFDLVSRRLHVPGTAGPQNVHNRARPVFQGREAQADAEVMVLDEIRPARSGEGIPDADFVNGPGGSWRSRFVDARWQVNASHRDYRAIAGRPALKLRYLAMLFAKEIVLRSSQDPRLDKPLEQLVEVTAYADRNVNERKSRRGPSEEG